MRLQTHFQVTDGGTDTPSGGLPPSPDILDSVCFINPIEFNNILVWIIH